MGFKCELCVGETKKICETESNEFWKFEKHHIVKEGKPGKEQVRNYDKPVFMVPKPKKP
jgi:hypothetical protein